MLAAQSRLPSAPSPAAGSDAQSPSLEERRLAMERLMVTPVALTPSSGVDDDVPVRAVTPLKVWKLLTVDTLRPFLHRPAEDENGPLLMEISQLVSTYGPVLAAVGLDARLSEWALQIEIFPPYRRFMLEQFIPAVELDGDALSVEEFELWMGKLFARLERYFGLFDVLERTMPWRAEVVRAHRVEFAAIVQRSHPARFLEHLERFYRHQIESGGGSTEDEEDGDVVDANGNAMDEEDDESPTSAAFFAFCRNIKRCHLLPVVWPVVCRLIRTRLELKISEIIDGTYDEEFLEALKEWKQDCVDPWLELVFQPDDTVDGERACLIEEQNKIGDALVETYCDRRIAELFDIIVEFPESEVALHELKAALCAQPGKKQKLVQDLSETMKRRLLQPAAKTTDIIDQYISTIKSLLLLDPTSVMLQVVTEPIREYLRIREDTVRGIIAKLFDSQNDALAEELRRTEPITFADDEREDFDDLNWTPLSRDMGRNAMEIRERKNAGDILNTLVNIFDSKEVFVKEFQTFLANRLLARMSYDDDEEVEFLEMLKLRFGESSMQHCEVMLKDVGGSKRVNNLVQAEAKNPINALVLSYLFWPAIRSQGFQLPAAVAEHFAAYERGFETVKRSRKLKWIHDLGHVDLELDLPNGEMLEVSVTPLQASVVWLFQEQDHWNVDAMAKQLGAGSDAVSAALSFWSARGVTRMLTDDTYRLVDESDAMGEYNADETDATVIMGGTSGALKSAQELKAEQMEIYWSYINGMLMNLGTLPLPRIQMMLTMFVQEPKYDCSEEELELFLSIKVREDHVELVGGAYRLKK